MSTSSASIDTSVLIELQIGEYVIAVVLLTVLSFLEKNRKGKRPGIVEPLNFFQDDSLSLVYGAAFGCTAYQIVSVINQMDSFTANLDISRFVRPWIRVFVWLLVAILASVRIYPVLATLRCNKQLVDPLIGLLYTGYMAGVFTYSLYLTITVYRGFEAVIVAYIPTLLCYVVLLCFFLYKVVHHLIHIVHNGRTDFDKVSRNCASVYQRKYVKWLLGKQVQRFNESSDTGIKRSLDACKSALKMKLGLSSPLRASPRVIVTFIVASIAVFEIGITSLTIYAQSSPRRLPELYSLDPDTTIYSYITTFLTVLDVSFYLSVTISSIFIAVYICTLFLNYRKDLANMQRGDYSFLPMKLRKSLNDNLVAASLRYAGMQIAYLIWCYVLCTFVILIGCFLVAYIVILPLTGDVPMKFFEPIPLLLPIILVNFIFRKLQVIVSRKVFLQDHDVTVPGKTNTQKALALDNIKTFNILTFFMFFFHAIIGFISCISRIMIGLAIGLVSLARIDRCMLPRGFEKWDKGYSTYVGMIMVELYHRNPVLTVFCDELLSVSNNKRCTSVLLQSKVSDQKHESPEQKYYRICRRWQKAYTLLKNPSIRKIPLNGIECAIEEVELHVKC